MSRNRVPVAKVVARDTQRALNLLWEISGLTIYASTPRGIDALRKDFLEWYWRDEKAQTIGILESLAFIRQRLAAGGALPWSESEGRKR